MIKKVVVVDLFKDIVSKVSQDIGFSLNYMHGHPLEITNSLQAMTADPLISAKKYPLIALFQDFPERNNGTLTEVELNLIIANLTSSDYLAYDRYDKNFKPYLYPIYDLLMFHISRSTFFNEIHESEIKHTAIDRLYWGRNGLYGKEGNIFNDRIDAIEIQKLILNVKQSKCK